MTNTTNYEYRKATDPEVLEFHPEVADYDDADFTNALVKTHRGAIVEVLAFDGGEPEDNTFTRDWSWVAGALNRAYELGYYHGRRAAAPRDALDMG